MSTPRDIVRAQRLVADYYGITTEDLVHAPRTKRLAEARQVAMWIARQHGFSYVELASGFERDHTTVVHAVQRIEGAIATKPDLARIVSYILGFAHGSQGRLVMPRRQRRAA